MKSGLRSGVGFGFGLTGLLVGAVAHAGCSRPIEVPMAPVGFSIAFDGERATGMYPALLQDLTNATGCQFKIRRVPRARLQTMFELGQADLMAPAARSPDREALGEFVGLVQFRPAVIAVSRERTLPHSLAELVARRTDKVAVVRGYTYGPAYDQAMATLRAQHRLLEQADAFGVARALRVGLAHFAVMTPNSFIATLHQEASLSPLIQQLRVVPLAELGWADSGVYLSHRLPEADRRQLADAFRQLARSGRVWQLFNDCYPPGSLKDSLRPLP